MHLVFRLGGAPLQVWRPGMGFDAVAHAVVGGVRKSSYIRALTPSGPSVGAQLQPGACAALFGVSASALAGVHTPVEELWGPFADEARARLAEAPNPEARLRTFEALLLARLDCERGLHPAVAQGLVMLRQGAEVRAAVAASGYSHRHFIRLFEAQVGAGPKTYARLLRLQCVLQLAQNPAHSWATVAAEAGYADQAHLTRELTALTDLTPGAYRRAHPTASHHVPITTG